MKPGRKQGSQWIWTDGSQSHWWKSQVLGSNNSMGAGAANPRGDTPVKAPTNAAIGHVADAPGCGSKSLRVRR